MNINNNIKSWLAVTAVLLLASCAKKLDLYPQNSVSPDVAYGTVGGYDSVLAKIYGTLAVSGNNGPDAGGDLSGLDGGSQTGFIRGFFNCEELTTDEAFVVWNDQTIKDFHNLSFTSSDPFIKGMYARPIYNITLINEYLSQATEEKLTARGITGANADAILKSRAEVRFLRAFNYWVMLDLFGKSTFITDSSKVGDLPVEINRTDLFDYIEKELLAIDGDLLPAKTNIYGRVDKAAEWALLARLYLNAEVYTGTPRYNEAATYAQKVINAGYSLASDYKTLFMADNDKRTNEIIFPINCDGLRSKAYSNTTFFIHAAAAASDFGDFGVVGGGGWSGYFATPALADLFTDISGNSDKRALFTTSTFDPTTQPIAITNSTEFNQGLHVKKYVNIRTDGGAVSDPTAYYSDIDFPVFRLPEMYLIYAEAVLRGGSGNKATALQYVNNIRMRAYGNASNNISEAQLTLQFILDERGRELYWEGHRRTDLIRYKLLTSGSYLWPWKGGIANGTAVDEKYNLFPVPADFITVNPNLSQNAGF